MQQAECEETGTVLYSLASSPLYFCNQTQVCARDRVDRASDSTQRIRGMYGVGRLQGRQADRQAGLLLKR